MLCVENLLETLCKLELWINFSLGLRHGWCPCKYKGKLLWTPGALPCVCSAMANARQPHGLQPTRLLCPWDVPGKNTGVGRHFLLQGTFLTRRLNSCLLLSRQILYHWATWEALIPYYLMVKSPYFGVRASFCGYQRRQDCEGGGTNFISLLSLSSFHTLRQGCGG